jgi:hypothetical protein
MRGQGKRNFILLHFNCFGSEWTVKCRYARFPLWNHSRSVGLVVIFITLACSQCLSCIYLDIISPWGPPFCFDSKIVSVCLILVCPTWPERLFPFLRIAAGFVPVWWWLTCLYGGLMMLRLVVLVYFQVFNSHVHQDPYRSKVFIVYVLYCCCA